MKNRSSALACALAAGALATGLSALQAPRPQTAFRTGVDYVRVDVVVTDANDRPVINLTKDDFEIVEDGQRQAIDDFEFVSVPTGSRLPDSTEPEAPAPDVATNAPPSTRSRLFALVIDDLHIVESEIVAVKQVMTEFIRALSPDDEVAVVFVGHSNLSRNFTSDRKVLLQTVDRVRDALGFGLDSLGRYSPSNVPLGLSSTGGADPRIMYEYARSADLVLKNVAMSLAGSTHPRRAIVYVTGGSVISTTPVGLNDFEDLQDAYEHARRADVAVYTLDPRGQVLPEDAIRGGISSIGGVDADPGQGPAQRASIMENIRRQQDRLSEIAVNTGGRAFTGQSDLTRAVREIVSENGSYYLIGYYPNPFKADGRFHTFDVHVKRPGVRVRARKGYVASSATASSADAKPILDEAMKAGANVSGISLRAVAAPLARGTNGMKTVVTVEVAYPPRPDGSRRIEDEFRMSILAVDPDGRIKASSERALRFSGTVRDSNDAAILINDVMDLPSQALTLRIGVASRALGKAGTIQMAIDVPKASDDGLQLVSIVLGRAGESPPAMNAGDATSLLPFQPLTTRTFAATDTLRVFGRAFWRAKSSDLPVVTIAIKTMPARTNQPKVTTSPERSGHLEGAFDGTVSLSGLVPGNYVLEVAARLGDGKPVTRDVPFSIR
jgi:VWFA-related protein